MTKWRKTMAKCIEDLELIEGLTEGPPERMFGMELKKLYEDDAVAGPLLIKTALEMYQSGFVTLKQIKTIADETLERLKPLADTLEIDFDAYLSEAELRIFGLINKPCRIEQTILSMTWVNDQSKMLREILENRSGKFN